MIVYNDKIMIFTCMVIVPGSIIGQLQGCTIYSTMMTFSFAHSFLPSVSTLAFRPVNNEVGGAQWA